VGQKTIKACQEVGDHPSKVHLIFVAIWVDKQAKRHERGRGGPGVWAYCGPKIDKGVPGRLESSQGGPINFSWTFG